MSVTHSRTATADPTPRLKQVRAAGTWEGQMRTRLSVRDFAPFATGEPVKAGGDDSAPTPTEYVIAALNGCLAVVVETIAGEHDLTIDSLQVEANAQVDTRGFAGTADVRPYFSDAAVTVHLGTPEVDKALDILPKVERRCPVLTLLRAADVDVTIEWVVS